MAGVGCASVGARIQAGLCYVCACCHAYILDRSSLLRFWLLPAETCFLVSLGEPLRYGSLCCVSLSLEPLDTPGYVTSTSPDAYAISFLPPKRLTPTVCLTLIHLSCVINDATSTRGTSTHVLPRTRTPRSLAGYVPPPLPPSMPGAPPTWPPSLPPPGFQPPLPEADAYTSKSNHDGGHFADGGAPPLPPPLPGQPPLPPVRRG